MDSVRNNSDDFLVGESADLIGTFYQKEQSSFIQSILLKIMGLQGWMGFHFVDGVDGTTIVGRGLDQYPVKPVEIIQSEPNKFSLNFIRPSLISVSLAHTSPAELKGKFSLKGFGIPLFRFSLTQFSTSPYFKKA